MDLQFLCFAFCGMVIVAFYLGLKIGMGRRAVLLLEIARCQREVDRLWAVIQRIYGQAACVCLNESSPGLLYRIEKIAEECRKAIKEMENVK